MNNEDALKQVKQDGYALEYVEEQTAEICLEALKQNGYVLMYVKDKSMLNSANIKSKSKLSESSVISAF